MEKHDVPGGAGAEEGSAAGGAAVAESLNAPRANCEMGPGEWRPREGPHLSSAPGTCFCFRSQLLQVWTLCHFPRAQDLFRISNPA